LTGLKIQSLIKNKNTPPFCLKRTKGKHCIEKSQKYSSKVQTKEKKTVKSQREHLAEKGEEDNKVNPFTRKASYACI